MTPLDPHLLSAVCADPADDGVRLAAADWLEEHGEAERSEFIRVQMELAAPVACEWEQTDGQPCPQYNAKRPPYRVLVHCPSCAKGERLRRREWELLDEWWTEWAKPLSPKRLSEDWHLWDTPVFRRGFVASITLTAADWLRHADALCWHPDQGRPCPPTAQPITEVTLTTWPELDDRGPYGPGRTIGLVGRLVRIPFEGPLLRSAAAMDLLGGEWPWLRITLPKLPHITLPKLPHDQQPP